MLCFLFCGTGDLPRLLAERYPDVNWVLAHAGAQQVEHHIRIAREVPNSYMELCGSMATYRAVETSRSCASAWRPGHVVGLSRYVANS